MMIFRVIPSKLKGEITIPPSKSQTLRAILFGSLASGTTTIHNALSSPDADAMILACRQLGAKIETAGDKILVTGTSGRIQAPKEPIQAGNSGIVLRFISAVAALSSSPILITGDHSVQNNRPMQPLLEGLTQLGVSAHSAKNNGFAPVSIQGPLQPGAATIIGEDSQPVSALLIASSFVSGPTTLHVKRAGEKPWAALTLSWLDRLGISYWNDDFQTYYLHGNANIKGFEYKVPGDLSSAAFPAAAAIVTRSELILHDVDFNDPQGDGKLFDVLQEMGADIEKNPETQTLHIRNGKGSLKGCTVDINDFIDSIAILAVVACFAEGETRIINAAIARTKECDRIQCLAVELKKMGADITELSDGLVIRGSTLRGADLFSHGDHRVAMALTVAALGAKGESIVHDVDCIEKTYPNFLLRLCELGAMIKV